MKVDTIPTGWEEDHALESKGAGAVEVEIGAVDVLVHTAGNMARIRHRKARRLVSGRPGDHAQALWPRLDGVDTLVADQEVVDTGASGEGDESRAGFVDPIQL